MREKCKLWCSFVVKVLYLWSKKEVKMVTVYYCVGVDLIGQPIYVAHYLCGVKL